jgi:aspartate oxidase
LETRDALSATILRECGERGKGVVTPTGMMGVWLDTPLVDLIDGDGTFIRRFAGIHSRLKKYGIDPIREPILVYPTQHYQNGGVHINTHGETNVPNLYTVGEASGGVHGHNRLGSNSLQDIFVFGRRAGAHAAHKTQSTNIGRLSLEHVKAHSRILQQEGIDTGKISPLLLPDYRFEKALPTVEHQK